ncbi:hypothetical protein D3C76_524090 [compost metagenome]
MVQRLPLRSQSASFRYFAARTSYQTMDFGWHPDEYAIAPAILRIDTPDVQKLAASFP